MPHGRLGVGREPDVPLSKAVQRGREDSGSLYVGLTGDSSGLKPLRWVRGGRDPDNIPSFGDGDEFAAILVEAPNDGRAPKAYTYR